MITICLRSGAYIALLSQFIAHSFIILPITICLFLQSGNGHGCTPEKQGINKAKKKRMSEIQSRMKELDNLFQRIYEDNIGGKLSDERFMKLSKGYDTEQADLQKEMTKLQEHIQQAEKQSVNVDRFLSIVKKYTDLTELTPETLHEFVDKIIVHAPDKSSGRRLQEIEIIYNHIGTFDHSKVTLWKGKAV